MWLNLISMALVIAVTLALLPWAMRRSARNKHFSNVPTVTIVAALALFSLGISHFAMYIEINAALLAVVMWFIAYRFRQEGPVVGAALLGLTAITILSG